MIFVPCDVAGVVVAGFAVAARAGVCSARADKARVAAGTVSGASHRRMDNGFSLPVESVHFGSDVSGIRLTVERDRSGIVTAGCAALGFGTFAVWIEGQAAQPFRDAEIV